MLSPSPAVEAGRGREGLAQTAPGPGDSQLETGFNVSCHIMVGKRRAPLPKHYNSVPTIYSRNQRKSSAASSTSNYSTKVRAAVPPRV